MSNLIVIWGPVFISFPSCHWWPKLISFTLHKAPACICNRCRQLHITCSPLMLYCKIFLCLLQHLAISVQSSLLHNYWLDVWICRLLCTPCYGQLFMDPVSYWKALENSSPNEASVSSLWYFRTSGLQFPVSII